MQVQRFSINQSLTFGITQIIEHFGLFFVCQLLRYGFYFISFELMTFAVFGSFRFVWIGKTAVQAYITQMTPLMKWAVLLWMIANYIMHRVFLLGFTRICLDIYAKKIPHVHQLWSSWYLIAQDLTVRCFIALLLCVPLFLAPVGRFIVIGMHLITPLPILVGVLLLLYVIIFLFLIRLSFVQQIIVDKEVSPVSAIITSYDITQSVWFKLCAFWLVIMVLNLIGYASGFGFIFTLSISYMAHVFVYKSLVKNRL